MSSFCENFDFARTLLGSEHGNIVADDFARISNELFYLDETDSNFVSKIIIGPGLTLNFLLQFLHVTRLLINSASRGTNF